VFHKIKCDIKIGISFGSKFLLMYVGIPTLAVVVSHPYEFLK